MIKKVVILAGGKGTRMGSLTSDLPKHLIPVNGRPFIYYLIDNLLSAGLTEIIIAVGHKKEKWQDFIDSHPHNLKVVDQNERITDKYGTACPVEAVEPEVGKDNFIAVNGDNLYSVNDIKAMNHDDDLNYIAGFRMEHPERYGVLESDQQGYLIKIHEKSANPPTNLINSGLYKFTPQYFDEVKKIDISPRGEYEITDVITRLARQHRVKAQELKDYWYDFGKPDDIEKVSEFLKNNK